MKNVVTPETARKLKEAGFPQPTPAFGQFWCRGAEFFVCTGKWESDPKKYTMVCIEHGGLWDFNLSGFVFAPTAPDILRELGNDYHIGILDGEFVAGLHQFGQSDLQFNDNPAEAAALVWLEKYAK